MMEETHSIMVDTKRRILIVDDHPLFRHGLSQLINAQDDLAACGEAESAPGALEAIRRLEPDVVVLDISLKGTNGIELMKAIKAERPKLPVLVVSMHDESLYALRALRAGARGYVMKEEALDQVMSAMRKVLSGEIYVSKTMADQLIYKVVSGSDTDSGSVVDRLTDRELEILQLIGQGHSTREIAQELNLSIKTVESHRLHIKEKLKFKTALEMVRFAVEWVAHPPEE
jgi:DNA-binding NarL/FixJ family response regulator